MAKKTVNFNQSGAAKLPTDKPVVYKVKTAGGKTNYVGIAKRGRAEELPEKYRFLLFENEWQSFRTKKDRSLEMKSAAQECTPGKRKVAVKVVDIFGNDTMTIVEVTV